MYRYFGLVLVGIVLGLSAPNVRGQVTPAGRDFSLPRAEVSLTYSPTAVNSGPSQCGCFVINGAAVEGNFRTYRGFTTVADVTAAYTNDIHNTGVRFALIMATGGIRLNYRVGNDRFYRLKPFMQGLVGVAHGFDSAFPNKSGYIQPTANSIALLAGVGVDYVVMSDGTCTCASSPRVDRALGKAVPQNIYWSCRAATPNDRRTE